MSSFFEGLVKTIVNGTKNLLTFQTVMDQSHPPFFLFDPTFHHDGDVKNNYETTNDLFQNMRRWYLNTDNSDGIRLDLLAQLQRKEDIRVCIDENYQHTNQNTKKTLNDRIIRYWRSTVPIQLQDEDITNLIQPNEGEEENIKDKMNRMVVILGCSFWLRKMNRIDQDTFVKVVQQTWTAVKYAFEENETSESILVLNFQPQFHHLSAMTINAVFDFDRSKTFTDDLSLKTFIKNFSNQEEQSRHESYYLSPGWVPSHELTKEFLEKEKKLDLVTINTALENVKDVIQYEVQRPSFIE